MKWVLCVLALVSVATLARGSGLCSSGSDRVSESNYCEGTGPCGNFFTSCGCEQANFDPALSSPPKTCAPINQCDLSETTLYDPSTGGTNVPTPAPCLTQINGTMTGSTIKTDYIRRGIVTTIGSVTTGNGFAGICLAFSYTNSDAEGNNGDIEMSIRPLLSDGVTCASASQYPQYSTYAFEVPNRRLYDLNLRFYGDQGTQYNNFFTQSGECLLADVGFSGASKSVQEFSVAGPVRCGFQVEAAKFIMTVGDTFHITYRQYDVNKADCTDSCPNVGAQTDLTPYVSCIEPCVTLTNGGTTKHRCMAHLGYFNQRSTTVTAAGGGDMGYLEAHPGSQTDGVVNAMLPMTCSEVRAHPVFQDDNENFRLYDSTGQNYLSGGNTVANCGQTDLLPTKGSTSYSGDRCSLRDYVYSFDRNPSTLWSGTGLYEYGQEFLDHWWERLGYGSPDTNNYVFFGMQPMTFASGFVETAAIVPMAKGDEYCWVLGATMHDIRTTHDYRNSDLVGKYSCEDVSLYAAYTYFSTEMRRSGTVFQRLPGNQGDAFALDNAYRLDFKYQIKAMEYDWGQTHDLTRWMAPLPDQSCMTGDNQNAYFNLDIVRGDCMFFSDCPGPSCPPTTTARFTDNDGSTDLFVRDLPPGFGCWDCGTTIDTVNPFCLE
eukprot:CAMPEP_0119132326 /NCGR_PEP_ID=MMETSP1310-20130426/11769_1 /TAXON_ID=464262 /ORGANISM="Genus nov. species nov., Strain RCC2339" /LENGTH=655 /DNA_ID=CAMNT_0007122953 /DNA_START=76 /DNA_END=2043 /DNA_ORIENTATION=+